MLKIRYLISQIRQIGLIRPIRQIHFSSLIRPINIWRGRSFRFRLISLALTTLLLLNLVFFSLYQALNPKSKAVAGDPPVLYWNFDEGYGSTAYDTSTYQNNGTITEATFNSDNPSNDSSKKSLNFDGSNDKVGKTYSSDTELDPGTGAFSVSLWFKAPSTTPVSQKNLISRYSGAGYQLYMTTSGYICFGLDDDSSWGPDDVTCTTTGFADSKWHHVEAVRNSTTATLYIDGQQKHYRTLTISGSLSGSSLTFYAGIGSDGSSYPWNGFIDEVRVFNYERTAPQVQQEFTAKATSTTDGSSARFGGGGFAENLTQGLVGYWKMDETSWTQNCSTYSVLDSSGNSNNGTSCESTSGPAGGDAGKFGNGGYFDGTNDEIHIADSDSLSFGNGTTDRPFSISAWIKMTDATYFSIFSKGTNASREYVLYVDDNDKLTLYITSNLNSTVYIGRTSNYALTAYEGSWIQVGTTYDGSNNSDGIRLFINGQEIPSTNSSNGTYVATTNGSGIGCIGDLFDMDTSLNAEGYMDEVRVYNRVLSPAEVTALYEWAPGPVAYWKMDENTDQYAYDSSGNNLGGATLGANSSPSTDDPTWTTGKYGSGLDFDGSADYAYAADSDLLSFGNSTNDKPFTLSAWVNADDIANATIITKGPYASVIEYKLELDSGNLELELYDNSNSTNYIRRRITTAPLISTGSWYHVAATYDGSSSVNGIKLYVNGIAATVYTDSIIGSYTAMHNTTGYVYFGKDNYGIPYFYNGKIDDVKIYNYARTPAQIVQDMNANHPAPGSPVGSALLHYKFDEGYGDTVHDLGYGGNDGNLGGSTTCPTSGCPIWINQGKFDKAIDFNRKTYDYIEIADTDELSFGNGTTDRPFSISAWVRADDFDQISILNKRDVSGNYEYRFGSIEGEGDQSFEFYLYDADGTHFMGQHTASLVSYEKRWVHMVGTYNGSSSNSGIKIYMNGKQISSSPVQNQSYTAMHNTTASNTIGDRYPGGAYLTDATIDELRVYNFELTADQVKTIYNQGSVAVLGALSDTSNLTGGSVASSSAQAAYCVPGSSDPCAAPVAEWKMDENTGTGADAVKDTSGNNYHGTMGSSKTVNDWVPGKFGPGLKFNNTTNDSVSGSNQIVNAYPFSISGWFKTTSTSYDKIFSINNIVNNSDCTISLKCSTEDKLCFGCNYLGAGYMSQTSTSVNDGKWHFFTAVAASSTDRKIYLDGIYEDISKSSVTFDTSINAWYIGGNNWYYDGLVDNIRVYNYARTSAQIAWEYNQGAPIAWYQLDECTGSTAYSKNEIYQSSLDGSIDGIFGGEQTDRGSCSVSGNTFWFNGKNGRIGASINLDGTDDDIIVNSNDILSFGDGTTDYPFGISLWVKKKKLGASTLVTKYTSLSYEYSLHFDSSDNLIFKLYDQSAGGYLQTASNTLSSYIGQWLHITVTYDGSKSTNGMKLYINSNSVFTTHTSSSYTAMENLNGDLWIGGFGLIGYLQGQLDDVRIYNYALTPQLVKQIYNTGAAVRMDKEWTCGDNLTVDHKVSGGVAPVDKKVTYGTVLSELSGASKCWITKNLGATDQASSATDSDEASAGWYWQFNRKQGYKHDGVTRTPNTSWITSIDEDKNWETTQDPCTLELGPGWRLPTSTEWTNADSNGGWDDRTETYASVIKLHNAGYINTSDTLTDRGNDGRIWSGSQDQTATADYLYFGVSYSTVTSNQKSYAYSVRCIKD